MQALRSRQHLTDDARTFIRRLVAVAAKAGHVQENVSHAVIRNDEAITLGNVEPFDNARNLYELSGCLVAKIDVQPEPRPRSILFQSRPTP